MRTLAALIDEHAVDVLDHLDRQASVPVLTDPQAQGDVSVLPDPDGTPATTPIPTTGVAVVRGENGGNTHVLLGPGAAFDRREAGMTVGVLTVPPGGEAFLAHPEHGYTGIGPGTYRIGRQREWAGQWRTVAD